MYQTVAEAIGVFGWVSCWGGEVPAFPQLSVIPSNKFRAIVPVTNQYGACCRMQVFQKCRSSDAETASVRHKALLHNQYS